MTPELSPREADFLNRLIQGDTIQQIARDWHYGESGARSIGERMRKKLGAKTNAQAVLIACRAGILDGRPRSQRHGDHPGYTQHQKRGEEACQACKAGERAYQVERRQRRRQESLSARHSAPDGSGGAREGRDAARVPQGDSGDSRKAAA